MLFILLIEEEFKHAVELDATFSTAWRNYSALLMECGRSDEGFELEQKALQTRKFKICTARI
jgi:hypothetical protein